MRCITKQKKKIAKKMSCLKKNKNFYDVLKNFIKKKSINIKIFIIVQNTYKKQKNNIKLNLN